jgi:hypothetical protein
MLNNSVQIRKLLKTRKTVSICFGIGQVNNEIPAIFARKQDIIICGTLSDGAANFAAVQKVSFAQPSACEQ